MAHRASGSQQSPATDPAMVDLVEEDAPGALQVAAARQIIYEEGVRTKNDLMMKHMRAASCGETKKQRDCGTNVSMLLRTRAKEFSDAEAKLGRESIEEERLWAKTVADCRHIIAQAKQAVHEARLACLQQIIVNKKDAEVRKHAEVMEKAYQRWLQTQYPTVLGRSLTRMMRKLSEEAKTGFDVHIRKKIEERVFERQLFLPELWAADKTLTVEWQRVIPFSGGDTRTVVRCGLPFQEFVDAVAPKTHFGHDPVDTLYRLFQACVPQAKHIFTAHYTPLRLLHVNEYVLEKAFVYGIAALTKWLGKDWYPLGVHGMWPPKMPAELVPKYPGTHVDTAASSQAASSSSGTGPSSNQHTDCTTALSQAAPCASGTVHAASASPSPSGKKQKILKGK